MVDLTFYGENLISSNGFRLVHIEFIDAIDFLSLLLNFMGN